MKLKAGWHIGKCRSDIYEICYGYVVTGYWSAEGYSYDWWGFVINNWTFGVGRVRHHDA